MAVSLDVGVANQHPLATTIVAPLGHRGFILIRLYSVRCKELLTVWTSNT